MGVLGADGTEVCWLIFSQTYKLTGLFSLLGSAHLSQCACALPQPDCPSWEGGLHWPQAGISFFSSPTHPGPLGSLRVLLLMQHQIGEQERQRLGLLLNI